MTDLKLALLVGLGVVLPSVLTTASFLLLSYRTRNAYPEEWTSLVRRIRETKPGVAGEGYWIPKSIISGDARSISKDPAALSLARVCIVCQYWLVIGAIALVVVTGALTWIRS